MAFKIIFVTLPSQQAEAVTCLRCAVSRIPDRLQYLCLLIATYHPHRKDSESRVAVTRVAAPARANHQLSRLHAYTGKTCAVLHRLLHSKINNNARDSPKEPRHNT